MLHTSQLRVRLEFLNFLLDRGNNVSLNIDHINIVWVHVIEKSTIPQERDTAFLWFETLCGQRMMVKKLYI